MTSVLGGTRVIRLGTGPVAAVPGAHGVKQLQSSPVIWEPGPSAGRSTNPANPMGQSLLNSASPSPHRVSRWNIPGMHTQAEDMAMAHAKGSSTATNPALVGPGSSAWGSNSSSPQVHQIAKHLQYLSAFSPSQPCRRPCSKPPQQPAGDGRQPPPPSRHPSRCPAPTSQWPPWQ